MKSGYSRFIAISLVSIGLMAQPAHSAATQKEKATIMTESKKRKDPPIVDPFEFNGVRYESATSGSAYGYQQDGGILLAKDAQTHALISTQRVYRQSYNEGIESDKQDQFISKISLGPDQSSLLVESEDGSIYRVPLLAKQQD